MKTALLWLLTKHGTASAHTLAGVSVSGMAASLLPVLTEWMKFGSATVSMVAGLVSLYLHYKNRKNKEKK